MPASAGYIKSLPSACFRASTYTDTHVIFIIIFVDRCSSDSRYKYQQSPKIYAFTVYFLTHTSQHTFNSTPKHIRNASKS